MLSVLEVEEYLLKERFDTKYLHQVSYLRDAYTSYFEVPWYNVS